MRLADTILEYLPELRRNFRELRIFVVIRRIIAFDIRQVDNNSTQFRQFTIMFDRADAALATR